MPKMLCSRTHPRLFQIVLSFLRLPDGQFVLRFHIVSLFKKRFVQFKLPSSTIAASKQYTQVTTRNYVNVTKRVWARDLRRFY